VRDELRDVMKTRNSDPLYRIGLVIRIMNPVQKNLKSDGVINVGVIRGNDYFLFH
jgi:hypothetical protein